MWSAVWYILDKMVDRFNVPITVEPIDIEMCKIINAYGSSPDVDLKTASRIHANENAVRQEYHFSISFVYKGKPQIVVASVKNKGVVAGIQLRRGVSGRSVFLETGDEGFVTFSKTQNPLEEYTGHHVPLNREDVLKYVLGDHPEFRLDSRSIVPHQRGKWLFNEANEPYRIA